MRILKSILIATMTLFMTAEALAERVIVYNGVDEFDSRVYLIFADGSSSYFEYPVYRFADIEIVNNEVYLAEAFAPRVYKMNIKTGELKVVVDDWSLFVFYGIFNDGQYFYVREENLRRYTMAGKFESSAKFSEKILGSAWDGRYMWTMNENALKSWDISQWPKITETTLASVAAPAENCRGLWHDGHALWTVCRANAGNQIIQFTTDGKSIEKTEHQGFPGWAAGFVEI